MPPPISDADRLGFETALAHAQRSYDEGGVPIGAALVWRGVNAGPPAGAENGEGEGNGLQVIGQGHNMRVQKSSAILHAEIAALDDAGRRAPGVYRNATMVSPGSPMHSVRGGAESRNWGAPFIGGLSQYTTLRCVELIGCLAAGWV